MLDPQRPDQQAPGLTPAAVATAFGVLLLIAGAAAAGYVFFNVIAVIGGEEPRLIAHLVEMSADHPSEVVLDSERVVFSEGIVRLVGFAVLGLLYLIAASIALSFVKYGAGLLQPELARAMQQLSLKLEALARSRKQ